MNLKNCNFIVKVTDGHEANPVFDLMIAKTSALKKGDRFKFLTEEQW